MNRSVNALAVPFQCVHGYDDFTSRGIGQERNTDFQCHNASCYSSSDTQDPRKESRWKEASRRACILLETSWAIISLSLLLTKWEKIGGWNWLAVAPEPMNPPVLPQSKEGISLSSYDKDNRYHTGEVSFMCTHSSGGKGKRAEGSQTVRNQMSEVKENSGSCLTLLKKSTRELSSSLFWSTH